MSGAVVLVPSSKAKEPGGEAPAYAESPSTRDHPLAGLRREVLEQLLTAAEELDDKGIARLCGVPSEQAADHRERLRSIATSPTMPASRRYTGVVHRNAGLAEVVADEAGVRIAIFGGLLGVAWLEEPVPDYRLEVTGRVPELGVLGTWWREGLAEHLIERSAGRLVYDLLPKEHERMWPSSRRDGIEVVRVRFRRPDGRAAPSASTKVAKGLLLRHLIEHPTATPDDLAAVEVPGWRLSLADGGVEVVLDGR
jgi:uncharacterized protein